MQQEQNSEHSDSGPVLHSLRRRLSDWFQNAKARMRSTRLRFPGTQTGTHGAYMLSVWLPSQGSTASGGMHPDCRGWRASDTCELASISSNGSNSNSGICSTTIKCPQSL